LVYASQTVSKKLLADATRVKAVLRCPWVLFKKS